MTGYDIIGDIHGHGDKLEALLRQMGYSVSGLGYKSPAGRQVVFRGHLVSTDPRHLRAHESSTATGDGVHSRDTTGTQ